MSNVDISDHNFLSPGYIWRNIVSVLQRPEIDTLNKGVRTVVFGNVRHKLEEHVEETMIDELAKTGECVIPKVGKVYYNKETHELSVKFTHEFQSRVDVRAYKTK